MKERGEWGEEMSQTLYAHMNKKIKKKRKRAGSPL
jgi:hypothetical protein